jgi:hypothetical protein
MMMRSAQMDAMLQCHRHLAEHLVDMNRGWLALAQEFAQASSCLSARLLACDASDTGRICAHWYGEQVDRGLRHARELRAAWMEFATSLSDPVQDTAALRTRQQAAPLKTPEHAD